MTNYSPIKYLIIQNFRNIGEVTIDFTKSPIITLIGDNESGKTSVVKAFGVCAKHVDPRSQKDYIRDGTTEFGVAIILEDGTKIIRQKGTGASNNRYKVVYPDGHIWNAQKLENEVPKAVQDVMGLIEEPETKELLHIRTYEDQLLFVVTSASTNYKVMYDALKISQLTRAIKSGSTEANALKAKISAAETSVNTLRRSISDIKIFDIEPLINIRNKLGQEREELKKLNQIVELKNQIEAKRKELGALELINSSGIKSIDAVEVDKLNRVGRLVEDIKQLKNSNKAYSELSGLESLDVAIISKMNDALERKNKLGTMEAESTNYLELNKLDSVSEIEILNLNRIVELLDKHSLLNQKLSAYSNVNDVNAIENRQIEIVNTLEKMIIANAQIDSYKKVLVDYNGYIDKVIAWMKEIGVATASCPKCGESIVIDIESQIN